MKGTLATRASMLVLTAMLTACGGGGGGGVNSTPAPPTAGGGGGSTPTPSPTPTPSAPPTGSNTSLKGSLLSETFQNDATSASAAYTANGLSKSSAAVSSVGIVYNAIQNSYIISSGDRTQTFSKTDLKQDLSNSTVAVYLRDNGQTTDSLTIFSPLVPIDPAYIVVGGPRTIQTEYVNGAVWQRTTKSGSSISGSLDSATFGVVTPNNAIPRSGQARFEVSLAGVAAQTSDLASLKGYGTLITNFLRGDLIGSGSMEYYSSTTGVLQKFANWSMDASLSADKNAFAGRMTLDGGNGSLNGRFYGPQARELGAAFAVTGGSGSNVGATSGVIIGRRWDSNNLNSSISDLKFDQRFVFASPTIQYVADNSTGRISPDAFISTGEYGPYLRYGADSKSYSIYRSETEIRTYSPSDLVTGESNGNFSVYRKALYPNSQISVYKSGVDNAELQLTYTTFVYDIDGLTPSDPGNTFVRASWIIAGINTAAANLPKSGSADYAGKLYGTLVVSQRPTAMLADITGDAQMKFDFSAGAFSASLKPMVKDGSFMLNPVSFVGNVIAGDAVTAPGFLGRSSGGSELKGVFNGPSAEEISAKFLGRIDVPGFTSGGNWIGVVVAKRQ